MLRRRQFLTFYTIMFYMYIYIYVYYAYICMCCVDIANSLILYICYSFYVSSFTSGVFKILQMGGWGAKLSHPWYHLI